MKGKKIKVLGDGFITLVDYMGTDIDIVNAAKISYGNESDKMSKKEIGLLNYLMSHKHSTPFEMCVMKFHVRCPMDVWRQWIRHRTASVNEYSTRYSTAIDSAHTTLPDEWREQSTTNKQGSGDAIPIALGESLSRSEQDLQIHAREVYEQRLVSGVAKEQARKDLPLSTYTEAFWCCNLHNILNFLRLRLANDAQYEIRQYANAMVEFVENIYPHTWEAFYKSTVESITLSTDEQKMLRYVLYRDKFSYRFELNGFTKRQRDEFMIKLEELLPASMFEHMRKEHENGNLN